MRRGGKRRSAQPARQARDRRRTLGVLDGLAEFEGQAQQLATGQFHIFASNCRYAYRNDGELPVRFVRNVVI